MIDIAHPSSDIPENADCALVDAARAGSPEAFALLVRRYYSPIVRLAFRITRDPDEAKDIAQDVFLRAFRSLDTLLPERPFESWLFFVARNASLDAIRRRHRTDAIDAKREMRPLELGPEHIALRKEQAAQVRMALEGLPLKYRTVLELYYVSDLRYRDIAEALNIPIGTVKTHLSRAKRRLRAELDDSALRSVA